jgi:hypothetical protein
MEVVASVQQLKGGLLGRRQHDAMVWRLLHVEAEIALQALNEEVVAARVEPPADARSF